MIDYHKEIAAALETVLPTYYELVLHSGLAVPCISYMELNNYQLSEIQGAEKGYSVVTYQVKIWGHDIGQLQAYAKQTDTALRPLGFKRIASNELFDRSSTMIQKILTYEAIGEEIF